MVMFGQRGTRGTGGSPRQSASEPPVSCRGNAESLSSASAAAVLLSDEPKSNMLRIMQLCRGNPPVPTLVLRTRSKQTLKQPVFSL